MGSAPPRSGPDGVRLPIESRETGTVVVVDDAEANRALFSRLLHAHGYVVHTAQDGAAALEIVRQRTPDLVLSDVMMPGMSGIELCARLKQTPDTRLVPVVLVTGTDIDARLLGIEAGADDFLRKPVKPAELIARVRVLIRVKRYVDELDSAESMIVSLARAIEARDPFTAGHCDRMAQYAATFGTELTLRPEEVLALHRGGILHDLGKIAVPDAILLKDGPLTPAERDVMRRHTIIGDSLCKDLKVLRLVRPIIRQHHERVDGSGYPDGACGESVSLLAQMIGIVDVYDALTTARPYRAAQGPEVACNVLAREAEMGWRRRDLVTEFIRLSHTGAFHHVRGGLQGAES